MSKRNVIAYKTLTLVDRLACRYKHVTVTAPVECGCFKVAQTVYELKIINSVWTRQTICFDGHIRFYK